MAKKTESSRKKKIETLTHEEATRRNNPTAEMQSFAERDPRVRPEEVRYERDTPLEEGARRPRDADLDPQLVWKGKDEQDWSDLVTVAPPIYIQEKIHPKAIVDDLKRQARKRRGAEEDDAPDLFADFNGLAADPEAKTEFYAHDQHWTNRMILGDSLQVMASLAEKEQFRGKVQCIYIDPPYGIKFNSNWQVSTRSRDVKDGKLDQISREPEQIKAFRDTWRQGIHSYLTYLRDRLTVARDLLSDSGSIFVQIGDENVHIIRSLLEEVFGKDNFVSLITVQKTTSSTNPFLSNVADYIIWFAKHLNKMKYNELYKQKILGENGSEHYTLMRLNDGTVRSLTQGEWRGLEELPEGARAFTADNLQSASMGREKGDGAASWFRITVNGRIFYPTEKARWKTNEQGMSRLIKSDRVIGQKNAARYIRFIDDFSVYGLHNIWSDTGGASDKIYVVETAPRLIQRCILMTTDPGDLVLDPTCGSGTTATVAEQWGRRWITIDTSRVALALARARIMGARYPYYLLADSPEGQRKAAELAGKPPSQAPTHGDIRHGFVYKRVPHITLKSIANNAEIDVIWDRWQETLEPLRAGINRALGRAVGDAETAPRRVASPKASHHGDDGTDNGGLLREAALQEWQLPREAPADWPDAAKDLLARWWEGRIERQREIDAAIARQAEQEYLYDQPYADPNRVRVAGPFTFESLSPHRVIAGDEDVLAAEIAAAEGDGAAHVPPTGNGADPGRFTQVVLDHLKLSGVQQSHKEDRIEFTSLTPWPGERIAAEGRFPEGERERKAGIFIGPEFGTVGRPDLVAAAREAAEAGFDLLIACAFNFDAHASEFDKLGPVRVVRARMNPDLHMADELKNTGGGNLFVVFGEPDVDIEDAGDGRLRVRIRGLDIFDPAKGEVRSGGTEDIAAWFVDTDYNEESFFVRHAYFLGGHDPYKALKTALKAEIGEDAWATLHRDVSRPFPRPETGRIAVKVINHFGDEVMQVFGV